MTTRSRTTRVVRATALASALTVGLAGTALGYASTVTLWINQDDGIFKGKVISAAPACEVNRKVLLVRIEPDDSRTIVDETFTNAEGKYSTFIPMQSGNPYFAKVRRVEKPNGTVCGKDRSPTKIA